MDWWLEALCLVGGYQMIHGLVASSIVSGRRDTRWPMDWWLGALRLVGGIPDDPWTGG